MLLLPLFLLNLPSGGEASPLVADPGRTAAVEGSPVRVMGRDHWYLLKKDWLELDGVKEEPFVKESGTHYAKWDLKWPDQETPRVIFLRDLKVYAEHDDPAKASGYSLKIEPIEPDTQIYHPEHLADNDLKSVCGISGSIASAVRRYTPVEAKLNLQFSLPRSVRKIVLAYGTGKKAELGRVSFFCDGREIRPDSMTRKSGVLKAEFKPAPRSKEFTLLCRSAAPVGVLKDFPEKMQQRLLTRPFDSHLLRPVPFGLSPRNFDVADGEKLMAKYEKSHIGIGFTEWDSQAFLQSLIPTNRLYSETVDFIGPMPDNREDAVRNMENFWNWHRELFFNRIWGMSGSTGFAHYGMEWGGRTAGLELTNNSATVPHRTLMRYTAGAGRQYGRPWLLYLAYFMGKLSPNSLMPPVEKKTSSWGQGMDAGISASFSRRVFLSGYFMGNTFLGFEAQPWGQAQKKDGKVELNANGKVLKEFYEWTRSDAGKRGVWYTPILFAVDYQHGLVRDGNVWAWGSWSRIPQTRGDLMSRHFNRAIDYWDGNESAWSQPPYSHNLHNSALGDIFDTELGNPPSGVMPQFRNYAVVILPDEIRMTEPLKEKLMEYVRNGGTLVINVIHRRFFPAGMMTAKIQPDIICDSGLKLPQVVLNQALPAFRTDAGNLLAVSQQYGRGKVIMTLPKYFLGDNPEQPNPYIGRLLEALQREVLPFQVAGDCQFIISRLAADHWKVALINNKGVLKEPWERQEKFDPRYAAEIEIRLPASAEVSSVYRPVKLKKSSSGVRLVLPPGDVAVLEIRGVRMPPSLAGTIIADTADRQAGRKLHPFRPVPQKPSVPGGRKECAPRLIGEWKLDGTPGRVREGKIREKTFDMNYAQLPSGRKVYDVSAPQSAVQVKYSPGLSLPAGSFTLWAAPDFNARLSDRGGYPLAGRFFRIMFHNRRWSVNVMDSAVIAGPAAKHRHWDHLVFTWNRQECRFFVNGEEYSFNGVPIKIFLPVWNNAFDIGSYGRGRRTFGGKISDVRLYSGALSPDEIKTIYLNSKQEYQGE